MDIFGGPFSGLPCLLGMEGVMFVGGTVYCQGLPGQTSMRAGWRSAVRSGQVSFSFPAFITALPSAAFSEEELCCVSLHCPPPPTPQMGFQGQNGLERVLVRGSTVVDHH